jgi:SAM-dependent methyltransferase
MTAHRMAVRSTIVPNTTVQAMALGATFRDPAGSLRMEGERVLRTIRPECAKAALEFVHSGLAHRWMAEGRLVGTSVLEEVHGEEHGVSLLLEHERIAFPSYPWEWTPGQWSAAASLTLELCEESLADGWILKDATPLNVLFRGPRPVFVDVLSFEKREPESPLWLAYAQFVRTFLLPLAAHTHLGWPLSASLHRRDGYEPADLHRYLSVVKRWTNPLRSLITLPRLLERRAPVQTASIRQPPLVAAQVLRRTLRSLGKALERLTPAPVASRWSGYATDAPHYRDADHAGKEAFVRRALALAAPRRVLDMGANTGRYSRLAAAQGAEVVAWDTDVAASEQSWQQARRNGDSILPLVADVARPTPAVGWKNSESAGLLERAYGSFDCVMMLGLFHHLLLMDQIPLPAVVELLRDLTSRWAIVEWVPAEDSQFLEMCRGRENLYRHLNEDLLRKELQPYFTTRLGERLANGRTLWLLELQ